MPNRPIVILLLLAVATARGEQPARLDPGNRIALNSPMVVTQLPAGCDAERHGPIAGGMLRSPLADGARLIRVEPGGTVRVLSQGFHSASDPDVSFDGTRILFAGKRQASDDWNIFEMASDGSHVRQITHDLGDCRSPVYQSTLYTLDSPEPWFQITFVSTAAGEVSDDGSTPATSLYSAKLDGTAVRRLTFNLSSDFDPVMMPDGRLLYAGWQRSTLDHGQAGRISLFGIDLDGADNALFAEPRGPRVRLMPCVTRGGLAVFVESDQSAWDGAGQLACVEIRRPLKSYRSLTDASQGRFHSPAPLPDGRILVSRRPATGGTHGVYIFDPKDDAIQPVFDDPHRHDIQARLLVPRSVPDGRSSVVTETEPHGKLYCLDATISDLDDHSWMTMDTIRRLRVLEGVPKTAQDGASRFPLPGLPRLAQRRLLGEIDVERDGSFNIEIPANTPVELQLLDADGMALRSCSWIWAKNNEPRGCVGCHEDGELTPENVLTDSLARPSIPLCLPPSRRRCVDFRRDVMPIIERKCVVCHAADGALPRLDSEAPGERSSEAVFNRAYRSLLATESEGDARVGKYVDPGRARASPLVWHLFGRNTSRPWDGPTGVRSAKPIPPGESEELSDDDRRTFIEWVDLGALWDGIPGEDK